MSRGKVEFQLRELDSADPKQRANMLRVLAEYPPTDPALVAACERLLDDTTLTLLGIPYRFGEVRSAAVEAVWAIRSSAGVDDPVIVRNVVQVCTTNDVGALARAAGVEVESGGVNGVLRTFERLVAANKVPRRDHHLETLRSKLSRS